MTVDIWGYIEDKRKKVGERINQWISEIKLHAENLWKVFEKGKRLRSVLTILIGEALGFKEEDVIDFATAIEFVHNATLIHDDIIDSHSVRRGSATLWKTIGIHDAVITGDLLFTFTGHKLSSISMRALEIITRAIYKVTRGVYLETNPLAGKHYGHELYAVINRLKTAELFGAASKLGSILTENEEIETAMYNYGIALGEAYQYADDLVDVVQLVNEENPEIDLKPIRLLISYMLEDSDLHHLINETSKEEIVEILRKNEAENFLKKQIEQKIKKAEKMANKLPESKHRNVLKAIPRLMVGAMLKEI